MTIDMESGVHAGKAMGLFLDRCDCIQPVFMTFCDLYGMNEKETLRLSSSFGSGMERPCEVCEVLSDILMTVGLLHSHDR